MTTATKRFLVMSALLAAGALGCSKAAPQATVAPAGTAPLAPVCAPADPVIVRLVGRETTVTITSTPAGPRYSAATRAGESLASNLSLSELRDQHPDLYQFVHPSAIASASDRTEDARPASDILSTPWAGLE